MRNGLAPFALVCAAALAGCAHHAPAHRGPDAPGPRAFQFQTDTFAFANETVRHYEEGRPVARRAAEPKAERDRYTHHCFVMSRAAIQFWKFARFDSGAPAPERDELAGRIRRVVSRPAWQAPAPEPERVVIPGFASLRDLSEQHPGLVQSLIGDSWTTYFRPANVLLVAPPSAAHRRRTAARLDASLARHEPVALWLYNFPRVDINHCVVAIARREEGATTVYSLYDPNYTDGPRTLTFDHPSGRFSMEPTFYFRGGPVKVRAAFRNALQ